MKAALWLSLVRREFILQFRQLRFLVNYCLFFLMLLLLVPLTLKPDLLLLRSLIPGLIWIALLLAFLLSAEQLFQQDEEQGVLEQWLLSGESLPLLVSAKVFAHWPFNLLPLILMAPLIAILYSLNLWETWVLILSLICGTPFLLFLCALAAAFGLGFSQKGALMALILLPLAVPVLIFGSGTLSIAMQGLPISGYLAILLALSLLALGLLPFAIAEAIRLSQMD